MKIYKSQLKQLILEVIREGGPGSGIRGHKTNKTEKSSSTKTSNKSKTHFSNYETNDPNEIGQYLRHNKNFGNENVFDWKEEDEKDTFIDKQKRKGLSVYHLDVGDDSYYIFSTKKPLSNDEIKHFGSNFDINKM